MKFTNKLNLPRLVVEAVMRDTYDPGSSDYTATGLTQPGRIAQLIRKGHGQMDISEGLYTLQGQLMHLLFERSAKGFEEEGYIVEKRFYGMYGLGGRLYKLSAQIDFFDPATATLSDYKYVGMGTFTKGLKDEYLFQLNFQAELIRRAGFQVEYAEIILLARDWNVSKAGLGSYPLEPIKKQTVPLMTSECINEWVLERLRVQEESKVALPRCTDEERWSRPTFALLKALDAKRATRVFDTKGEAESYMKSNGGLTLIERPGISIRCLRYCPVRHVCEQAKEYRGKVEIDNEGFTKL